jgi:hypothetical protein
MALAMSLNPYESPQIPAGDEPQDEEATVAWPATGAFRYYQTLVWHTGTPLPPVCVRTGLPADTTLVLTMRPLIDDDGSIHAAYEFKPKLYEVVLPINAAGCKTHDWRQAGLYSLLVGCICGAIAAFWPGDMFTRSSLGVLTVVLLGIAAVVCIAAGLRWLAGPMRIQLLCIDRTYLQLFGLHPSFLSSLPEWPVPDRDSVRR